MAKSAIMPFETNCCSQNSLTRTAYWSGGISLGMVSMEEDRREGADGLATKVFPLSITELNGSLNNAYKEGAALSYFRTEATARRKWSRPYWTRTPTGGGWTPSKAAYVTADGAFKSISAKSSYSYRPALVLPQEVLVDREGNVLGG